MQDPQSVIVEATKGFVEELAKRNEVGLRRMYAILESDWYPKAKRRIRDIGAVNPDGARLIRCDILAMFDDILGPETEPVTDAELHEELNDAVQAKLRHAPKCVELKEDREAIGVLTRRICEIEKEDKPPVRVEMARAVEQKRSNGHQ